MAVATKQKKPKYKANPLFVIEEYCDIYCVYRKEDINKETLCCTYNPNFHIIYVGKGRDEEAVEELKLFLEHKNYKDFRINYSKSVVTQEENLEDTEYETEPKSEPVQPVKRRTRKTK